MILKVVDSKSKLDQDYDVVKSTKSVIAATPGFYKLNLCLCVIDSPRGSGESKLAIGRRLTRPRRHGPDEGVVPDVEQVSLLRVEDDGVVVAHRSEPHGPTEVLVLQRHFAELDSLSGVVDVDGLPRLGPVPPQDAEQLSVGGDQGAVSISERGVLMMS